MLAFVSSGAAPAAVGAKAAAAAAARPRIAAFVRPAWRVACSLSCAQVLGRAVAGLCVLACSASRRRRGIGATRRSASSRDRTFEVATTTDLNDSKLLELAKENAALLAKLEERTATVEDKKRLAELSHELADLAQTKADARTAVRAELAKRTEAVGEIKDRKDRINMVLKQLTESEKVDLLFVVDCTGSMEPHIGAVKDRINGIVQNVMARSSALQMKVGFLGYRDIKDARRFEKFDLSDDHAAFRSFVKSVKATGGGDGPEDIMGALKQAGDLTWSSPTRVILHLADCPCHGTKYHKLADDYPAGDPSGLTPKALLRGLQKSSVHYYFGKITSHTDQMIRMFNQVVGADEDYIKVVALDRLETFTEEVSKSVSASIAATFMVETGRTAMDGAISVEVVKGRTKRVAIDQAQPDWQKLAPTEADVFATRPLRSMSDLKRKDLGLRAAKPADAPGSRVWIKISPHAFAAGANRYAHWAKMGMVSGKTALHDRSVAVDWETMVAKQFKKNPGGADVQARHFAQMENSMVASFLAHEYNKVKKPEHKTVEVLRSYVIQVGDRFYTLEKPLPSAAEFLRFSSNSGFWNTDNYNPTLGEFTRWTLRATKGYLLVSDLQGVELADRIVLTDPAIHCEDLNRFGGTNLGPDFMERVLKSLNALEKCT